MITSIAFTAYPVSDITRARDFYERVLGLKLTHEFGGQWFEYDIGESTFVICAADEQHPAPARGALLALEVSGLDQEVSRLKQLGVEFRNGIAETPVCRFVSVTDPDGSEVLLHERKPKVSS